MVVMAGRDDDHVWVVLNRLGSLLLFNRRDVDAAFMLEPPAVLDKIIAVNEYVSLNVDELQQVRKFHDRLTEKIKFDHRSWSKPGVRKVQARSL